MPAYDRARFEPPAPVALVTLRAPDTDAEIPDVPMLLDSGADVTLVPLSVMSSLGLSAIPGKHRELVAFDGSTSFASVARLELRFCRRTFRGQFPLIDQEWGILGRNVLNVVPILLDGPNLAWHEQPAGGPS
jgi:hypothetical protein